MRGYSALEDVPMIVPIALALILFFSSLSWAVNTVNSVNRRVDMTIAAIRVADVFAQWGVLTDDTWELSCNAIRDKEKAVYFSAHLVKPENLDVFLRGLKGQNPAPNNPHVLKSCMSASLKAPNKFTDVYVRFFPITYQNVVNGMVDNGVFFLVVRTWPKE